MSTQAAIDLQPFCAKEDWLSARAAPFVAGGWRYACDGIICVRMPAPGEPDDPIPWRTTIADLFHPIGATPPWPTGGEVRGECDCDDCDGEGKVGIESKCPKCYGDGECSHCGRECENCDGEGMIESGGRDCPACGGKGRVEGLLHRVIGVHCIAGKYDALIRTLPNVRYEVGAKDCAKPLAFVFDGGQGVIAHMNP